MPSQTVIQDYSRHPANCPEYRAVDTTSTICVLQCTREDHGAQAIAKSFQSTHGGGMCALLYA